LLWSSENFDCRFFADKKQLLTINYQLLTTLTVQSIAGRNFVTVLGEGAAFFSFSYPAKVKYPKKKKSQLSRKSSAF